MFNRLSLVIGVALSFLALAVTEAGDKGPSIVADKANKTVTIPCKIGPRKLPNLKQIYPLEVVATWPAPKGQKAHETVVVFDVKPSDVHKALENIGLKAGKPALGEQGTPTGPEVAIFLEVPGEGKEWKRLPIEETMVDTRSDKAFPKVKWLFTGSAFKFPDPEKDDKVYGADISGTLITIFPVTDDVVFQSNLGIKDESKFRLETNAKVLPKEGTAVRLVIQAK